MDGLALHGRRVELTAVRARVPAVRAVQLEIPPIVLLVEREAPVCRFNTIAIADYTTVRGHPDHLETE